MKKIFLLSIMIVSLLFVLAITAFADDIVSLKTENEEYGTIIQLTSDPGLDNAKQYVSTLKKINDSGVDTEALCILTDGTYFYVFPSSYVVNEINGGKFEIYAGTDSNPGLKQAMEEFNAAMGTEYYSDYVIVSNWGDRRLNEIVRFEFTTDVTWIDRDHGCMRYMTNLKEVRIGHAISFARARSMFRDCKNLEKVVGFEKVTGIESDTSQFMGCKLLNSVSLPLDITKIPESMFWGCESLVIDNLSEITGITTIGANAFRDSLKIDITLPDSVTTIETGAFQSAFKTGGSITINPTSSLQVIGVDAFNDSRALKSIYIPSTVTSIGKNAFAKNHALTVVENFENCKITQIEDGTFSYASALKTLKLPKTVTTIGKAFDDNNNLTLVYIPNTVTSIANTFTGGKPVNAVFVYTGKDTSIFANCDKLKNANIIQGSEYSSENSYSGINIVVGYSNCIVYNNGVHGNCENTDIVTSYLDEIQVASKCKLCDMSLETIKLPALFTCLGYSVSEYGNYAVSVGYAINNESLKEYKELTNKEISFGGFAVLKDKIGTNDIFDENGNATSGAISVDITERQFDIYEFKIGGFKDANVSTMIAIGMYTCVKNGEEAEYSYLQVGNVLENEKYVFVSYNDLIK